MPLIEIKYFEGEFTDDERSRLIGAVTDTMAQFTGDRVRPHTWVVLQEIRSGSWGIGGNALGLADVRAIQSDTDQRLHAEPSAPSPGELGPSRRSDWVGDAR